MGGVARQLRTDVERPPGDERNALPANEVRPGDAAEHRPELILHRRPAIGLAVQLTHVIGRLSDRLLDKVERADGVDRRLQNGVGRASLIPKLFALQRRKRLDFADLSAHGPQLLDHNLGCQ